MRETEEPATAVEVARANVPRKGWQPRLTWNLETRERRRLLAATARREAWLVHRTSACGVAQATPRERQPVTGLRLKSRQKTQGRGATGQATGVHSPKHSGGTENGQAIGGMENGQAIGAMENGQAIGGHGLPPTKPMGAAQGIEGGESHARLPLGRCV